MNCIVIVISYMEIIYMVDNWNERPEFNDFSCDKFQLGFKLTNYIYWQLHAAYMAGLLKQTSSIQYSYSQYKHKLLNSKFI